MICESCAGLRVTVYGLPCDDCGGSGITSCCDAAGSGDNVVPLPVHPQCEPRRHLSSPGCWCKPVYVGDGVYVHRDRFH